MSTYRDAIDWIAKNEARVESALQLDPALAVEHLKAADTVALVASVWGMDTAVVAEAALKARRPTPGVHAQPVMLAGARA